MAIQVQHSMRNPLLFVATITALGAVATAVCAVLRHHNITSNYTIRSAVLWSAGYASVSTILTCIACSLPDQRLEAPQEEPLQADLGGAEPVAEGSTALERAEAALQRTESALERAEAASQRAEAAYVESVASRGRVMALAGASASVRARVGSVNRQVDADAAQLLSSMVAYTDETVGRRELVEQLIARGNASPAALLNAVTGGLTSGPSTVRIDSPADRDGK
jgi:hypothetical protein